MNTIIPIQITLQAANASDARQLVQDLAGTMATINPASIPPLTEVSTLATPGAYPPAPPLQPQPNQAYAGVPVAPPVQQQQYQQPPILQPQPGAVPTAPQSYDIPQLAVAATALVDAGKQAELQQLLYQFGVQALTQLPQERYGEFATALRSMGARI